MNEKYYGTDEEYGMEGEGNDLPKSSRVASNSKHDSKQGWSDQHLGAVAGIKAAEQSQENVFPFDAGIQTPQRRRSIAPEQRKYNLEELGNNFEDTPWVPPSVKLAKEYRTENMFRGGKAKLRNVCVTKAQDCGTGLPLYFQFVKTMAIAFFFMALLSVPSLVMYHSGSRVSLVDRDLFGLYKYTLGNLGYSSDALLSTTRCTGNGYGISANSTCINVFEVEITLVEAASIITAFEFLQVCVFFVAVMYLTYKNKQLTEFQEGRDCQVSDYSIIVRDIPPDTTMQQILTHFSNLYQLREKDWRNRPPLAGAQVLDHSDNTQLDFHRGTWVAESVIFRKIGSFLRVFRNEQDLMESLLRSRAFMKMYKDDTLHAYGPNERRYEKAEKKLLQIGTQIDLLTESLIQKNKSKNFSSSNKKIMPATSASEQQHRRVSLTDTIEADACAAFIVFNYTESKARCIEDYTAYSRFPWFLFYPPKLKFRGQRIKVSKAPEPDEIIWENLEVPYSKKFVYRTRTFLVGVVLLVVGFAIILQSAVYQRKFKESLPDLTLCKLNIPALYYGSYDIPFTASIQRASTTADVYGYDRTAYDSQCEAVLPDSFYAVYTDGGDTTQPIATFSVDACTQTKAKAHSPVYPYYGECPQYNQTTFCPCVDVKGAEVCNTLACSTPESGQICKTFESSNIAGCYCYNQLKSSLVSLFTASGAVYMLDVIYQALQGKFQKSKDPCQSIYLLYSSSKGLTYAAALTTVVINMLLKKYLFMSTKQEYHTSFESEEGNIIMKVFFVTFVNMAIIVLLAEGYLENAPSLLSTLAILQGSYIDLTVAWYGVIGNYLVITFVLNSITPYLDVLPYYFIIMPYRRWRAIPRVEKRTSHTIAMQADLNKLLLGPYFHSTGHYAHLLAMTFFAMMYGPSIPLFMPLMSATFAVYFYFDKLLLCRYYQRPPHMSDGACRMVLSILPYAGLLRLAMACWMYGNSDITSSGIINTGIIPGYASANPAQAATLYNDYLDAHKDDKSLTFTLISKVVRANVFPLFFLFLFVILLKVLRAIWDRVPLYWVMEVLSRLAKFICRLKDVPSLLKLVGPDGYVHGYDLLRLRDPLRLEMAPYTGNYFRYMKHVEEKARGIARYLKFLDKSDKLLPGEAEQGWAVVQRDQYFMKVKKNLQDEVVGGDFRVAGTEKRTYEYIGDHGCYSYSLDRIPAYQMAVKGLKEGTSNIAAYNMEADGREQDLIVKQYLKKKRDKGAASDKKIIAELKGSKSKGSATSVSAVTYASSKQKITPFAGAPDDSETAAIIRKEELRRKQGTAQGGKRGVDKNSGGKGRGGRKVAAGNSSSEDEKDDEESDRDDNGSDEADDSDEEDEPLPSRRPPVKKPRTRPLDDRHKYQDDDDDDDDDDKHYRSKPTAKNKKRTDERAARVPHEVEDDDEEDWRRGPVTPTGFDDDGLGVPGLV